MGDILADVDGKFDVIKWMPINSRPHKEGWFYTRTHTGFITVLYYKPASQLWFRISPDHIDEPDVNRNLSEWLRIDGVSDKQYS